MKKENKKKVILIVIAAFFVALICGVLYMTHIKNYMAKYKTYSDQVDVYGFNKRYNDELSNKYKTVKKGEAIALVLSAVYNTNDITEIGYNPLFEDRNSAWVRYAEVEGVIKEGTINLENVNKKVTMMEVITYLAKCKELFLDQKLNTDVELKMGGIRKLTDEEKGYLKDAVSMGLVENKGQFNPNKSIRRGEFNKIIMDYMLNVSKTVALGVEIEEDASKIPSNKADYPFIVKGIEKEIYEIPFKVVSKETAQKPRQVYKDFKNISTMAEETVKAYGDLLLNVDYKTINEEELKNKYKELMQFFPGVELIQPYVEYVKANKLVLKGNITPCWPICYYDGMVYRLRCKVDFQVVEGNTRENVLLGDAASDKVTYTDNNSMIVDVPLEYGVASHKLYSQIFTVSGAKVK